MKKTKFDDGVLTHVIADVCSDAIYSKLQSYLVKWGFPKNFYKVCINNVTQCGDQIWVSIATPKKVKNYRMDVKRILSKLE